MNHHADAAALNDLLKAGRPGELVDGHRGSGGHCRGWCGAYNLIGLARLSLGLNFNGASIQDAPE